LLALLALAGCSGGSVTVSAPPAAIGNWQRGPVSRPPAVEMPELLRELGATPLLRVPYRRNGRTLTVEAYSFRSEVSAFEARQRFHQPGTACFHHGSLFVTAGGEVALEEITGFLRLLEQEWLAKDR
jgi:hypothetical protein